MEVDASPLYELDLVDDATATLIVHLQNRGIEELTHASKGKGRDAEPSDTDLAVAIYQQELQEMSTILADRCMGRSFTQAIISDAPLLRESVTEENAAARDRALAHRLAGIATPTAAPEQTIVGDTLDESFMARLAALYVSSKNDEGDVLENTMGGTGEAAAESSASAVSRQRPSPGAYRQCITCDLTKPLLDIFQTPSKHHYCQECLRTLFELLTTDETLFSP